MNTLKGVWLPIITPFIDGEIDYVSYKKMIDFYSPKGITGIMPNGTTGECPTIEEDEFEELLAKTVEFNSKNLPIYFGLGGNNTKKVIKSLKTVEKYNVEGILSVAPYYSRPDQKGIYEHFKKISEATDLKIVIYNIPYRTGRNIENETMFKLSELENIVAVKDSCGDINQTQELILNKPANFSVLTGEDVMFYINLVLGGDGGIMASSHLRTEEFVAIKDLVENNNHMAALEKWKTLQSFIPLLFKESNPGPLKYCLQKMGLIKSDELRLPMTGISENLKKELDSFL